MAGMLHAHLRAVANERVVGREGERQSIRQVFAQGATERVVYLWGEGGMGKTTLLGAAVAEADDAGWRPIVIDAVAVGADIGLLDSALAGAVDDGSRPPVVVIDGAEAMWSVLPVLRERIAARLPGDARVLIAGRRAPDPGWQSGGWEHITRVIPLGPLDQHDAVAVLARLGVTDARQVGRIVRWAKGLPLALAVGGAASPPDGDPATLGSELWRRVSHPEVGDHQPDALLLMAIVGRVDAGLLRGVVHDEHPAETLAWLGALSFTTAVGSRVGLHDRLRDALRREMRIRDPLRAQQLRLAAADHLRDRALAGEAHLIGDLRGLIDEETVQTGFEVDPNLGMYVDRVRFGDAAALFARLDSPAGPWWDRLARWLAEAPTQVLAVRDAEQHLAAVAIWVTPQTAPPWAAEDPILTSALSYAERISPGGNAVILLDAEPLVSGPQSMTAIFGLANPGVLARCGLTNPNTIVALCGPLPAEPRQLVTALGFERHESLDRRYHDRDYEGWVLDCGPGGLVDATHELVYRSCGATRRAGSAEPSAGEVRELLRCFHRPDVLANVPWAVGRTPARRAACVQERLYAALDATFGSSADELLSRRCIELGYLAEDASHSRAQAELYLSRTAYFRRLADACSRLAAQVVR